jgi:TonB-linked SusC/RagA family outer membrane protein
MKNSFIFKRLLLKIVKLSLVQLVLILIFTGITTATPVKGQEMLDTKVTLSLSNVSLENALSELEKSAKVKFSYNSRTLKLGQKVNVTAKNEVLSSVLSKLLKPLNIKYIPISNRIVLRNDEEPKVGFSQEAEQTTKIDKLTSADIIIKGTVADENGEKLPGVSITVKGTTKGSISNTNGEYSIAVQDEKSVLVFNFVGYYVQEIMVGNQTKIDVLLKIDNKTLDEVLVVGYGSVKKSDLTGSVASLKQEEFNPGANSSIDQLMLGKAAGVQITQNSSEPGGGVSVRIRGVSSLNAGSDPLYVIDGLPIDNSTLLSSSSGGAGTGTNSNPRNPLNTINPNDIESIEILKDASATAIYGSRGANGVILITTKKGKNGKVNVGYDFNLGTQSVANKIDILDTQQYIKAMNDISKDEGRVSEFSNDAIAKIGAGVDWQDQVLQSAMLSSHNLSISGGDDKTTFFSSLNYYDQDGVVKNTGIKKYIARVNLNRKLGENIRMGININSSLVKDQNSVDGLNNNENAGPLNSALLYDPTEPIYTSDGVTFNQSKNLTINNPLSLVVGLTSNNETNRTIGNLFVDFKIMKGLEGKLNFGSDRQTARRDLYNSTKTLNGLSAKGIANIATLQRSNVLLEYTMTYNKDLNKNSKLNLLGGVTYQYFNQNAFAGIIRTFPSDVLGTNNLGLGDTNNDNLTSQQEDNRLLSYLSRVNYSLYNKYLITASIRADGSSKFGTNNKYGYFPSVAFGWKLIEEKFIPKFFNDLKLRASWGITGNQDIANYASLTTYTSGPNAVFNNAVVATTRPSRIANPDLKWESTEQLNIGIDGSIWRGRLNATVDYFIKNTRDILLNLPLPRATGFESILSNVGKMQNKGFEFSINSINIDKAAFKWNSSINLSVIKNKVTDLGSITEIVTGNVEAIGNTAVVRVGYPAYAYYGYIINGIFQQNDDIKNSAQPSSKPGYPIFEDINNDKRISPLDQVIIGSPFPDFTYGIQNTITYKRLQLSFFIQGQKGGNQLNINVMESMYPNNFRRNRLSEQVLNRWTPENTSTKWPSGVQPSAYGGGKVNTLVLQDASYIRFKNFQLGYNLPVENTKVFQSARIYLTGQNLATITKYNGFDPEASAFGRSNVRLDYNGYPLARTYILGVNVNF